MRIFLVFIGMLFSLIVLASCQSLTAKQPNSLQQSPSLSELAGTPSPTIPPLPELNSDEVALGKVVYDQNCAACHGVNLEGQSNWKVQNEDGRFKAPPHNEDGHTWHHPDSLLLESIQLGGARFEDVIIGGSSDMPAFAETLSGEEITAVLSYIKSNWPDDLRQIQWEVTAQQE